MRIDVPQFSLEVPEGWGTPLLAMAGAVAYGVGWAVAAGLVHRTPVRHGRYCAGPLDGGDAFLGFLWPALVASEVACCMAFVAWRMAKVPAWPFVVLARWVAGDTCPRT
jgi:hypothetical protein